MGLSNRIGPIKGVGYSTHVISIIVTIPPESLGFNLLIIVIAIRRLLNFNCRDLHVPRPRPQQPDAHCASCEKMHWKKIAALIGYINVKKKVLGRK